MPGFFDKGEWANELSRTFISIDKGVQRTLRHSAAGAEMVKGTKLQIGVR